MPAQGSGGRRSTARSSRTGPDALWSRAIIEDARVAAAPPLHVSSSEIDPPTSSRPRRDACGIVAAGRARTAAIYVLEDATVAGLSPAGWAARRSRRTAGLLADALVAEVNQGGDMVRAVLREVDAACR